MLCGDLGKKYIKKRGYIYTGTADSLTVQLKPMQHRKATTLHCGATVIKNKKTIQ